MRWFRGSRAAPHERLPKGLEEARYCPGEGSGQGPGAADEQGWALLGRAIPASQGHLRRAAVWDLLSYLISVCGRAPLHMFHAHFSASGAGAPPRALFGLLHSGEIYVC